MIEHETEAASNLRNSRLMKPVRNRWALLVIYFALASAGGMGSIITQDIRILLACVIGGPIVAVAYAIFMSGFSMLVTWLSSIVMSKTKTKGN